MSKNELVGENLLRISKVMQIVDISNYVVNYKEESDIYEIHILISDQHHKDLIMKHLLILYTDLKPLIKIDEHLSREGFSMMVEEMEM